MWFGGKNVEIVNTSKVRKSKGNLKPIRVATVQSVASLQKSGEIDLLVGDVKALFVDEVHHSGSRTYTDLLDAIDHIYYRFGFTGTFLRNDSKQLDMFGFLSTKLFSYPAFRAIQEGFLTPLEVLCYNLNGKAHKQYQKEYDLNYCGSRELLQAVLEIVEAERGQILILVDKKDKAGQVIHDYLSDRDIQSNYISGDNKKEEIYSSIEDFNNKDTRILIGSKVIGEGIDIRSTDHLIMCQGGKSEIAIVQAAGRVVRLFDNKKVAKIHDFNFTNSNYLIKTL